MLVSCLKAISAGHEIKLVFTTKDTVGNDMIYVSELFCSVLLVWNPRDLNPCAVLPLVKCHSTEQYGRLREPYWFG